MKRIKLSLGAIAFIIGVTSAFAFKPATVKMKDAPAEYYANEDGSAGDLVDGASTCNNHTSALCSQEYEVTGGVPGDPTGNPAKINNGIRQ